MATFGNEYLKQERHAQSGEWGAKTVSHNNDKMKEVKQVHNKLKIRNEQIY